MRQAFSELEDEVLRAIARLANLEPPPVPILAPESTGTEQITSFDIEETEVTRSGGLRRAALERARDFASELGHEVNSLAPSGVRWTVRVVFERHYPLLMLPAKLRIKWSILPDARRPRSTQPLYERESA